MTDHYLNKLRRILTDFFKKYDVAIYLVGSRAKGEYRRHSDIDIAIEPRQELPEGLIANLREQIEESTIPYKVDIINLRTTSDEFRKQILKGAVKWKD